MIPSAFGFSTNYPEDPLAPPTPQRKLLTNSPDKPDMLDLSARVSRLEGKLEGAIETLKQRIDFFDKNTTLLILRMNNLEDKLRREENRIYSLSVIEVNDY